MAAEPSPAWIERTQRRQNVRAAMLAACDREASRARARSRRLERQEAAGRALVARIVAEGLERQDRARGPALFGDGMARVCPTLATLAAWAGEDARGTATECGETYARRLESLAGLVAELAVIAERIYGGGYDTAAELDAREGWTAVAINRRLSEARAFADLLAERAYQARRGCGTVATWARQGERSRAVKKGGDFADAARSLCIDVVRAGRDYLWTYGAHRAVRRDVLAAVGAYLTAACEL
jgi:hypothetical protein